MALFTSPQGRLVQGDCWEPQTKDQQGAPLTIKTGPNAGQPTQKWIIAVAHRKDDPATLPYLLQLRDEAKMAWPAYFTAPNNSPPLFGCTHPKFAIKIMDGDGIDDNGKSNASKPGMAGCWVVKYQTSAAAPKVFNVGHYDPMDQVQDKRLLPKGSMVRVRVNVESNKNDQRPGMYMNPNMVEISRVATGAEIIVSGEDAGAAFGAPPAGAPYTPLAPVAAAPVGIIPNPGVDLASFRAAGWTDDMMVQHGHATRAAPVAPPLPVTPPPAPPAPTPAAYTPPVPAVPPATPSPSSPPPPPYAGYMGATARVMLPAAGGFTYEQMIATGWTDAMMIEKGMMAP